MDVKCRVQQEEKELLVRRHGEGDCSQEGGGSGRRAVSWGGS